MARRTQKPLPRTTPKRIVPIIRKSNHYLKLVLMAILLFLLGAAVAYRFLQRLPVNNLASDLQSNQLAINPLLQPSATPNSDLLPSQIPENKGATTSPTPSGSPKVTLKPIASPSPIASAKPVASSEVIAKPTVAASPDPTMKPTPAPSATQTAGSKPGNVGATKNYTVKKGDSLWKIAQEVSGDPYSWVRIYAQNKQIIGQNPGILYAGTVLTIN